MNVPYDVICIGAGPTGLACAIEAKRAGLRALVIDKGVLCNSLYRYPVNMVFFTTPELLEIGDLPFVSAAEKIPPRDPPPTLSRTGPGWRGGPRRAELGSTTKFWFRPNIKNRIKARQIPPLFEPRVVRIEPDCVHFVGPPGLPAANVDPVV